MQNSDGVIIILSYPDTIVRPAYWERSSKIWPLIGIGGKHAVQAGHAVLLLIKKGTSEINYFDFGRYITTYGNGRVRSKETDPELKIPLKVEFENQEITNLEEILLWLDKHPEKTHGEGRMIATLNEEINYDLAKDFIDALINKKEIPYGAFIKNGTNCARFVTDTIIASTTNKKIKSHLKNSNLFTPSPIGNVIKGTTTNKIYQVENQKIGFYKNRSILKEYKESFLNKFDNEPNLIGTELPNKAIFDLENGTWLGGIGSGAWFKIEAQIDTKTYKIARYTSLGEKDFEGKFLINNNSFKIDEKYEFVYPTNCKEMYLIQNNQEYLFKLT
ncbi:MAG: DUF6695 family protein [Polaribacter sp.]